MSKTLERFLSLGAIIDPGSARLRSIAAAARAIDAAEIDAAVTRVELEGLGPMLYRNLASSGDPACEPLVGRLRALAVRHRHATVTRVREYVRLRQALLAADVPSAALKGIALAHQLYPEPGLRPMRDIDFLVRARDAAAARSVLEGCGYRFAGAHPSRFMARHHHLPNATRVVDGLIVSVEIHTSATSGDAPSPLRMEQFENELARVDTPHGSMETLPPLAMLDQLCRHALEPGGMIRLLSVMDIAGFAARFHEEIPWDDLPRRCRYIPNFLSLLHYVVPLPDALAALAPPEAARPADTGRLIAPLGSIRRAGLRSALEIAFSPPEWWLRCYYGVPPGRPLSAVVRARHVLRTTRGLVRRLAARAAPAEAG